MVLPSFGITYIRPCVTDAGKVSAETHLAENENGSESPGLLDSLGLCWLLNLSEVFTHVKCSENLGIAKMDFNGKTVVVSKGGRINVRTAEDRQDALETTRIVVRTIWPAMVCSRCGKTVLECASGLCRQCGRAGCPLLLNGVPDPTRTVLQRPETRTVREIFSEMEASGDTHHLEARKAFDDIFTILENNVAGFLSGIVPDKPDIPPERMQMANRLAQRLVTQGERQAEFSAGLALLGIGKNLETLGQDLCLVIKLVESNSDHMALEKAWNLVSNMYRCLWTNNPADSMKVKPSTKIRKAVGRALRGRESKDLRKTLESISEAGVRFCKIAELTLAV